jgi:hypothetical protein
LKAKQDCFDLSVSVREIKMQKAALTILGALLITGSAAEMTAASERQRLNAYRAPAVTGERLRDANASLSSSARSFCSQEAGNPYDEQTDHASWSAFRQSGAWDSRNDCP